MPALTSVVLLWCKATSPMVGNADIAQLLQLMFTGDLAQALEALTAVTPLCFKPAFVCMQI
jgi:hypothetical protein